MRYLCDQDWEVWTLSKILKLSCVTVKQCFSVRSVWVTYSGTVYTFSNNMRYLYGSKCLGRICVSLFSVVSVSAISVHLYFLCKCLGHICGGFPALRGGRRGSTEGRHQSSAGGSRRARGVEAVSRDDGDKDAGDGGRAAEQDPGGGGAHRLLARAGRGGRWLHG
eukprot:SAG22_NODE_6689_length_822_cov_2.434302_1_plen_164_part_10